MPRSRDPPLYLPVDLDLPRVTSLRSTILVVEDHTILRHGIKAILECCDEFQLVGETDNGTEAVEICKTQLPDIILMGFWAPRSRQDRIEATAEIIRHHPKAKIIMLSLYEDENSVVSAIRSGARGFLLTKTSADQLLEALRTVMNGEAYLSPQLSDYLLERIRGGEPEATPATGLAALSTREKQVLQLVAEGNGSKEIALMLDLTIQTVRSYRKALMKKLGVSNAAGLTRIAITSAPINSPFAADP
jgi:DNA-binding NarL/FixJ family response regulator